MTHLYDEKSIKEFAKKLDKQLTERLKNQAPRVSPNQPRLAELPFEQVHAVKVSGRVFRNVFWQMPFDELSEALRSGAVPASRTLDSTALEMFDTDNEGLQWEERLTLESFLSLEWNPSTSCFENEVHTVTFYLETVFGGENRMQPGLAPNAKPATPAEEQKTTVCELDAEADVLRCLADRAALEARVYCACDGSMLALKAVCLEWLACSEEYRRTSRNASATLLAHDNLVKQFRHLFTG